VLSVAELEALARFTRRLPDRGATRWLARQLRKFYLRKPREDARGEVSGCTMELYPGDYVEGQLLFTPHFYEAGERAWVAEHLEAGDVFVDLGAHAGCYTLLAARVVGPAGRVVAVEANPRTVERLRKNVRLNGLENVEVVPCGVSDAEELLHLSMNASRNTGASSFLIPVGDDVAVRCRPLLDVLRDQAVERVSGLKADIEGFEFRVLQRFLADAPESLWPGFVLVEQKDWWVEQAGGNAVELLCAHGYEIAWRTGEKRTWTNYVLTRPVRGAPPEA
jgi:FkbM family methyltransferase